MIVTHRDLECETYEDDEYCTMHDTPVETFEGAENIITAIPGVISSYTYVEDE